MEDNKRAKMKYRIIFRGNKVFFYKSCLFSRNKGAFTNEANKWFYTK